MPTVPPRIIPTNLLSPAMSPFCSLLNTLERLNHIHSFDHRRHEEIDNQRKGHGKNTGKDIAAGINAPAEHDDVCLDSGDDKVVQNNPQSQTCLLYTSLCPER